MALPGAVGDRIAALAVRYERSGPVRVAIDGRSAAGKTTTADDVAEAVTRLGRPAVRASLDDFHTPGHKLRSANEEYTPDSYYEEAFDYARFRSWVLDPLTTEGDRRCRLRYWNAAEDREAVAEPAVVPPTTVLIVDGAFLFRPELVDCWDLTVWIDVSFDDMVDRAVARDVAWVGSPEKVRRRYVERYVPLHALYERRTGARDHADVLIDNSDLVHPRVLRMP